VKIDCEINLKKTLLVLFCAMTLGFILNYGYHEYNKTQYEKYKQAKDLAKACSKIPGALIKTRQYTPIFGSGADVTCEYYSNYPN